MALNNSHPYRFECTQCGQCCSRPGFVLMTQAELITIARALNVVARSIQDMCLGFDGEHWQIEVIEGEHCPFLKNNRCSIHTIKPEQCRTYPFWPEIIGSHETWHAEAGFCPGIGHGKSYTTPEILDLARGKGSTD